MYGLPPRLTVKCALDRGDDTRSYCTPEAPTYPVDGINAMPLAGCVFRVVNLDWRIGNLPAHMMFLPGRRTYCY